MAHFFSRLFFILLGYALAAISSGVVVALCMHLLGNPAARNGVASWDEFPGMALFISAYIALFAAPFAAAVICAGEWMPIRLKRYYGIAGIVIGLILSVLFYMHNWFPYVGGGFGSVAGLIYWWIAGRRAGISDPSAARKLQQISLVVVLAFVGLVCVHLGYGNILGYRPVNW
jgi:hypothetical protein